MTIQVAIKLDDDLVARIDRLVAEGTVASRSQAVRDGLESLLQSAERQRIDVAYAAAYARHPETAEEVDEVRRQSIASIHDEPWERWW